MNFVARHAISLSLLALFAGCSSEPAKDATATTDGSQNAYRRADGETSPRAAAGAATKGLSALPSERSVYYEYDKSDYRPEARSLLEANARYLREHPDVKVRVEGNADERGSAEYNLALGQRRAEAVTQSLKLMGVKESRIEAVSLGKEKPKKAGHDETSWQENRRSDIVY
jgi:peptidoglycan-associated lipoprotein